MPLWRLGLLVFVAVTCVVAGDTAGKLLTARGVDPVQIAWARFAMAALVLLPFSGLRRAELPWLLNRRVLLRGAVIAAGIACILTGLQTAPIADVYGAFFIGPVVSYILAVALLKERVTALRSTLLGLGFLGVMLVVKPGFGTAPGLLFALGAGLCYGAYLALTRAVAGLYRPRFLLISQLLIGSVLLAPMGLRGPPVPLEPVILALLALSAVGSAAGNYMLVEASRAAQASLIAPLVYTQLISATVFGVLVFGAWPDALALSGLALICLSGFASLLLARQRAP